MLTLDPGRTTGWSTWEVYDEAPIELLDHGQVRGGLEGFINAWRHERFGYPELVVSESFHLDGRTPKPDVTPLKIEGALAVLCGDVGIPLHYQRNVMKAHAPDDLLKRSGLWFTGEQHARDAIRHAIAWAKLNGHSPTIGWLWPPPGEKLAA